MRNAYNEVLFVVCCCWFFFPFLSFPSSAFLLLYTNTTYIPLRLCILFYLFCFFLAIRFACYSYGFYSAVRLETLYRLDVVFLMLFIIIINGEGWFSYVDTIYKIRYSCTFIFSRMFQSSNFS